MRTIIILLFLALPAFPQMLQGIVGGQAPVAAAGETITKVGSHFQAAGSSTNVTSLSPSITSGQGIVVAFAAGTNSSTSITSCSATNATFNTPIQVAQAGYYSSGVCTGIATGTVSSVTLTSSATPSSHVIVYSLSLMAASGYEDLTKTNSSTYGAPSTGSTAGSLSATQVVFNVFDTGTSMTANGSGYTALDSFSWLSGHYITTQWKEAASGTQSGAITVTGTNTDYAAALVTVKEQ